MRGLGDLSPITKGYSSLETVVCWCGHIDARAGGIGVPAITATTVGAEITEDPRGDVRFIRRVFIEPIWETDADSNSRLVGRRNVHTGEVELVETERNG
jgi:hypothetical protein